MHKTIGFVLLLLVLAGGCGPQPKDKSTIPTPTPGPGARVLAISATPAHMPSPSAQDFQEAVNLEVGAGVNGLFNSYTWSSLEPRSGSMNVSKVGDDAKGAPSAGFATQYIGMQMINTTAKETPSDLQSVAWDDPAMKSRFHALVDAIAPLVAGRIAYFSIGNEVDVYLKATNNWTAFQSFFEDGVAYVHGKLPGVKVGTTITFGGAQANTSKMNTLTTQADVMIFTDYPLGANFAPLGASHGSDDLQAMVSMASGKPVVVQELGYPADSTLLGSSEDEQAAFVSNAFARWQGIGGTKMPFVNFFLMHDFSPSMCDQFARYYGDPDDAAFKAYLCSIGLRRNDGTAKKGWNAFVQGAANTGF